MFYVAVTRAEKLCYISHASSRFRNGQSNFSNPSRFIRDIDPQYLDMPDESSLQPRKSRFSNWNEDLDTERSQFNRTNKSPEIENAPTYSKPKRLAKISSTAIIEKSVSNSTFQIGTQVKHSIFGLGVVLSTGAVNGNEKVDIDFGKNGTKSLLLKFAKLEKLN